MKRQVRKRSITKKLSNKETSRNLEKETRKLVSKANARLDSLQRRFKSGTWASKKLANRLSSNKLNMWTKKGKIKIGKNLTRTQLMGLNKAINQFLNSRTSTKKGISDVRERTIETLRGTLSTEDKELTYDEAETYYEMFGDNDFDSLADKIPSSALQNIIIDAIDEDDTQNEFIRRLEDYSGLSMNDLDIREKAIRLYEKYVL